MLKVPPGSADVPADGKIPDCVNFCPPGEEQPPPTAALEPGPGKCTPLCVLIPRGLPGVCEEPPTNPLPET